MKKFLRPLLAGLYAAQLMLMPLKAEDAAASVPALTGIRTEGDQVMHPFGQVFLGDLALLVLVERHDPLDDLLHADPRRRDEPPREIFLRAGRLRHARPREDEADGQGGRQPRYDDASHDGIPLR